eukprot:502350-Prorocentrum_minimum.AAC.1
MGGARSSLSFLLIYYSSSGRTVHAAEVGGEGGVLLWGGHRADRVRGPQGRQQDGRHPGLQ